MTTSQLPHLYLPCVMALMGVGLALSAAHADDIYKSTDAQGRPVYSDRPLSNTAERVNIESKPRDEAEAQARVRRELAELARREEERNRELASLQAQKQAREQAEKDQHERCLAARKRYFTFADSYRLYRLDDAGNRVYYTAAEIDAEREASKRQMDEACSDAPRPR